MIDVRRVLLELVIPIQLLTLVYFGAGLLAVSVTYTAGGDPSSVLVLEWLEASYEAGSVVPLSELLELPPTSSTSLAGTLVIAYAVSIVTVYGSYRSRGGRLTDLVALSGGERT